MTEAKVNIRNYSPNDLEPVQGLILAAAQADEVDPRSTLEGVPNAEVLQEVLEAISNDSDSSLLVAEDQNTGVILGYGFVRWWQEENGTFVYLHNGNVHPEHRRHGVGTSLLTKLQERIQEIAISHPESAPKVYGANATETEKGANEFFQKNGYEKVWSQVEMEFTDLATLEKVDPPEGYELRGVKTDDDKRAVYRLNKEVYAGEFGNSPVSEEDYQEFLQDSPDFDFWKVLWHGDEIVGFVLSRLCDGRGEITQVSVASNYRRQGLGKYLMIESMMELKNRGVGSIRLHTGSEGKKGGRQLYESLGFVSLKEHNRYRKPLK